MCIRDRHCEVLQPIPYEELELGILTSWVRVEMVSAQFCREKIGLKLAFTAKWLQPFDTCGLLISCGGLRLARIHSTHARCGKLSWTLGVINGGNVGDRGQVPVTNWQTECLKLLIGYSSRS
eukprot:1873242-Amphidinium_carterae.1